MTELDAGQELALVTADGRPRTRLRLGLGWDTVASAGAMGTGAPDVDLDASALQFRGSELFDVAFYNHLRTRDGSVVHLGDSTTGRGDGDDEVVTVDLAAVHPPVTTIVLLVSSYQGHSLTWVDRASVQVVDQDAEGPDAAVADFHLTAGVPETGLVMATLVRGEHHWTLRAIGDGIAVRRPTDSLAALAPYL